MALELNGTTGVQGNSGAFVAGTAVASTSGTSIDFTSIPSWIKRITVVFNAQYAEWLASQPTKEEQIAKLQEQIDALKA
jgi:hypothetical protein